MAEKKLSELTNEELLAEAKKMNTTKIMDAVFFGVLLGIAVYSSVKNGLGLLSFIPLLYLPIAGRNNKIRAEYEKILKERGLK